MPPPDLQKPPPPASEGAALFEARGLTYRDSLERSVVGPELLSLGHRSLACLGGRDLLRCFVEPERILRGSLLIWGASPASLLLAGRAGYAPGELPAPPEMQLLEALSLGGKLIGLGAAEARAALARVELGGLAKKKLSTLTLLQHRLAGLAHALMGNPRLLFLEDPFEALGDSEAEFLETVLETELLERAFIVSSELESPWSRRLIHRAETRLSCRLGNLVGPLDAHTLESRALWARFSAISPALTDELRERGAEVIRTPHPDLLLIRALSGLAVAEVSQKTGCTLLELRPGP